jgi:UDP-4-amino-4,6-dideoxy-N-acetyl-beta-L-altrosamine N-acetyltransferase
MSIELVRLNDHNLQKIMEWRMKPEVTKYMYTDPILTIEKQQRWFTSIINNPEVKYWMINVDNVDVGVLDLCNINMQHRRCSWAYYIGDTSFRGRGIATTLECNIYDYVFDILKLNKICCEVFTFNHKVISIHQKFGSIIEGTLHQHIYKNGQYMDIVTMGITKDRWKKIKELYDYEKITIE